MATNDPNKPVAKTNVLTQYMKSSDDKRNGPGLEIEKFPAAPAAKQDATKKAVSKYKKMVKKQ